MILEAARLSASEILTPRFRKVVWKSVGMTILLFIGMWFALESASSTLLTPFIGPWPWLTTAIAWLLGAGVLVGAGFLLAPVTAIFAGFFIDDIAQHVEETHYSEDQPGKAVPLDISIWLALKFTVLVILANLFALLLVLLPGINFAIFFFVNGYLLGREFFQFAAMRFRTEREAALLRKKNSLVVFAAGLLIAALMSVPIVNLFTPVFAAGMMVHLHKMISARQPIQETE